MRIVSLTLSVLFLTARLGISAESAAPDWSMNASIIEACSCPMFCQCYFNTQPAAHNGHAGHSHGEGGEHCDFSKGQMDWAALTFDPSVTPEQREGIKAILGHVYPVKWNSFTVAQDANMTWAATRDHAEAKLGDGKAGQVTLNKFQGMTDEPIVLKNLKYWGVPRNDGFLMMPNEVEAYRAGDKPFEFKGTNGFMITIDINSKDVVKEKAGA